MTETAFKKINLLIKSLNESNSYIPMIFMQGDCYQFHLFLKKLYPTAKPYINKEKDHIVSEIQNYYFDITGNIFDYLNYSPLQKEDLKMVENWSFNREMMLQVGECPICEEPILV